MKIAWPRVPSGTGTVVALVTVAHGLLAGEVAVARSQWLTER